MKNKAVISTCCITALLAATGCNTTSDYSRRRAANAAKLLDGYDKTQTNRIRALNEEYIKVEAELRQNHIEQLEQWSKLDRNSDDRAVADSILIDWENKTLSSSIVTQFIESKEREIARSNLKRDAVVAAQKTYLAALQELSIPLNQIKSAKQTMLKLAENKSARERTRDLMKFLDEIRKHAKEEEAKRKSADKR